MFCSINVLATIATFLIEASPLYFALLFYYYNNEMAFDVCVLILQVSGKFNPVDYIYQLTFRTNRGRSLIAGQPFQVLFPLFISLFILIFFALTYQYLIYV
jgi:hypothetical protein